MKPQQHKPLRERFLLRELVDATGLKDLLVATRGKEYGEAAAYTHIREKVQEKYPTDCWKEGSHITAPVVVTGDAIAEVLRLCSQAAWRELGRLDQLSQDAYRIANRADHVTTLLCSEDIDILATVKSNAARH